nr:hypothetical protein [Tanacetum cinerariifolium]
MVAYLSKSDASAGFDQIVDFLNAYVIQYALMVNPTIYVSCIKQFWATASIKKANDVVQLRALINGKKVVITEDVIRQDICLDYADGVECLPNEEIFAELARMGYEKLHPKLKFYKAFFSTQWKFLIHTLVQCVSAKRTAWNEFSCSMAYAVICLTTGRKFNFFKYIFDSMAAEEKEEVKVPNALAPPSPTTAHSPPPQDPTPTPHDSPPSPPQEQPTTTFASSMTLLNYLLETCATLSQKVIEFEQDKHTQALKIIKLKRRVKKLEKKKRSKSSGLKRLKKVGTSQRVESSADTVVEVADMDVELQGRINQEDVSAATKDANTAEPTVFNDEEVTMNMAQTLIKMKAKKARLLNEQIAQRLHDEEVEKAAAREKQRMIWRAQVLQQKYQGLKRKPVSIAQAKKNMIIYLKNMANMAGYKMEHFRGMTYDKVRPIFKREYKKVHTLFKPDKDVEEPQKKRVSEETLLQESFKKLKAVNVSGSESTQDTPTNDPKEMSKEDVQNMLEIIPVSKFKVKALQVKYPLIDWEINSEGSRTYQKIIRVGEITEAYHSFEDMLKGFDREDLVAL